MQQHVNGAYQIVADQKVTIGMKIEKPEAFLGTDEEFVLQWQSVVFSALQESRKRLMYSTKLCIAPHCRKWTVSYPTIS